jgi:hypothetical protein
MPLAATLADIIAIFTMPIFTPPFRRFYAIFILRHLIEMRHAESFSRFSAPFDISSRHFQIISALMPLIFCCHRHMPFSPPAITLIISR